MLRIECPWCGIRNEDEFSYGGDATVQRPTDDGSMDEWYDYVYTRNNPAGEHTEHWQHGMGRNYAGEVGGHASSTDEYPTATGFCRTHQFHCPVGGAVGR